MTARWVIAVVGAVPVAAFVVIAASRLTYPYDLQWMEGSSVDIARRAATGLPLYTAPSLEYVPWPYPPLFYWVSGGLGRLVGEGYLPLRLVSTASAVTVLVLIGVIVTHRGRVAVAGLLAAGAYAATFQLAGSWADIGRVDSFMLALLLGGIATGQRARSWQAALVVGLLLAAAVMTKHNALLVAVPLLMVLWLRQRRVGAVAGSAFGVAVALPSAVLQWRSDGWFGEYVGRQLLGHGVAEERLLGFWLVDLALPLTGLLVIVGWWVMGQVRSRPGWTWRTAVTDYELVAIAGLLLVGWTGRLHAGGFRNVLMPAYLAVAIAAGLALAHLWRSGTLQRRAPAAVVTVILVIQVGLLAFPWVPLVPSDDDRRTGEEFVADVAATPGRVVVLGHPWYAELAGQPATAHVAGLLDVLDGGSLRARTTLAASLPGSLTGVDVVILSDISDGRILPALDRDFVRLDTPAVTGDGFWPLSDIRRRPSVVFVRRGSDGTAVPEVAEPWLSR